MKPGRWRNVILVVAAMALSLPLNLLGPLRPIRALAYTWDASVDTSHVPATWFTQTSPGFDITLTNPGTATWLAGGPIPVHFSVYFSPQNRDTVNDCVGGLGTCRYALPADVPAGGFATIHGQKATPFDVATYTLHLDLVREGLFWFETQTPNLPVSVGFQVKVACGSFCTTVVNSGTTQYWRLNDHQNGAGPYRHFMGATDAVVIAGYAATTTDGRLPADADAGSASLHVAPVFQAEPNNNSLNIPAGVSGFPDTAVMALGGWVKQDSDQAGHGACFLEGSPVNEQAGFVGTRRATSRSAWMCCATRTTTFSWRVEGPCWTMVAGTTCSAGMTMAPIRRPSCGWMEPWLRPRRNRSVGNVPEANRSRPFGRPTSDRTFMASFRNAPTGSVPSPPPTLARWPACRWVGR